MVSKQVPGTFACRGEREKQAYYRLMGPKGRLG